MVSSQVFESDISFAFVLITGNIKKVKMHIDKPPLKRLQEKFHLSEKEAEEYL